MKSAGGIPRLGAIDDSREEYLPLQTASAVKIGARSHRSSRSAHVNSSEVETMTKQPTDARLAFSRYRRGLRFNFTT